MSLRSSPLQAQWARRPPHRARPLSMPLPRGSRWLGHAGAHTLGPFRGGSDQPRRSPRPSPASVLTALLPLRTLDSTRQRTGRVRSKRGHREPGQGESPALARSRMDPGAAHRSGPRPARPCRKAAVTGPGAALTGAAKRSAAGGRSRVAPREHPVPTGAGFFVGRAGAPSRRAGAAASA